MIDPSSSFYAYFPEDARKILAEQRPESWVPCLVQRGKTIQLVQLFLRAQEAGMHEVATCAYKALEQLPLPVADRARILVAKKRAPVSSVQSAVTHVAEHIPFTREIIFVEDDDIDEIMQSAMDEVVRDSEDLCVEDKSVVEEHHAAQTVVQAHQAKTVPVFKPLTLLEKLSDTIERIANGAFFPHRNDGSFFRNYEGRLPNKPHDYYREYVHSANEVLHPGCQRVVVGRMGELFYSRDHYKSFE